MLDLKFKCSVKTLAQGDSAGCAHAPCLLQSCVNDTSKFLVFFITIQVILPQSQVCVKSFGHIQVGAGQD